MQDTQRWNHAEILRSASLARKISAANLIGLVVLAAVLLALYQYALSSYANDQSQQRLSATGKVTWDLLKRQGDDFRISGGKLFAGATELNGRSDLVDHVQELVGGVATVFMGDVRVATNIKRRRFARRRHVARPRSGSRRIVQARPTLSRQSRHSRAKLLYRLRPDPRQDRRNDRRAVRRTIGSRNARPNRGYPEVGALSRAAHRALRRRGHARPFQPNVCPLKQLRATMTRISNGDLAATVEGVERGDDIGDMARTVEQLR